MRSYIETLSEYYPTLKLISFGDGKTYEALVPAPGSTLPTKAVLDVQALALGQERAWRRIQVERERRRVGGIRVGDSWFHSDDSSRIQQIGLVMMGASLPPLQWKTMGGSFVTMTPVLAGQIFQTTATNDVAIFTRAEQHRFMMLATPNPGVYNFLGGWPLTFGE